MLPKIPNGYMFIRQTISLTHIMVERMISYKNKKPLSVQKDFACTVLNGCIVSFWCLVLGGHTEEQ